MSQPTRSPKRKKNRSEVGYVIPGAAYVAPEVGTNVPVPFNNVSCIGSFRNTMSRQQRRTNQDQSKPTTPRTRRKKTSKVRPEYANISPIQDKGVDKTAERTVRIVEVEKSQDERRQCNPRSTTLKINRSPGLFNEDRVIRARSDVYDIAASGDVKHHKLTRHRFFKRYWKHIVITSFITFFIIVLLLIITYKTDLILCTMNIKTITKEKEVDSFQFIKSSTQYVVEEQFRLNPDNLILINFCEEKRILRVDVILEKSIGSDTDTIQAKICDAGRYQCEKLVVGRNVSGKKIIPGFTISDSKYGRVLTFELKENCDKSYRIERIAIAFERKE